MTHSATTLSATSTALPDASPDIQADQPAPLLGVAPAAADPPPSRPPDGSGMVPVKILVVDDEPKNLTALEAVLAGDGRTLVLASSGPEALKHLLHEDFAVILLDVHMPLMDGFETAALIRGRERSRNTPIIFLTAAIRGDAQVAQGYSLGAVDYILKPFDPEILRTKVGVFVELFRAQEERRRLGEERAARAAAEAAQERFAFLAEASGILARSLDPSQTLQDVAKLVVSLLDGVCVIDLAEEDGPIHRVAVACADPAREPMAERLRSQAPAPEGLTGVARVLRTGQPALYPTLSTADLQALASGDDASLEVLGALQPAAALVLPLAARGRTLGAMTLLGLAGSYRTYGTEEAALVEDLARRVALAVDNARLYAEAQAAVRVRDEFLSSATHDLKTPLTVIKAQAQLLQRRASKSAAPDAEKIMEEAARIGVATAKMVGLVDQMLDVAALQMGRPIELRRQEMDLAHVAQDVATELTEPKGRHQIRVVAPKGGVKGQWDPARIERVLSNLLSNALKYSPAGGEVLIQVSREKDDDGRRCAVLRVQDQGVGIPSDEIARVFDRFFRGRNVVGKIAGTGIGLAGVRQIVEEHGGQIGIRSQEERGTTVIVHLPLEPPPRTSRRRPAPRPS